MTTDPDTITLATELLPRDGRFCSGPSKVRPAQVEALATARTTLLGTSHRQAPVRGLVGGVREKLGALFGLPDGWEVVLGNGGSTVFWDAATFGLVRRRSQHLVFGEFSSKFAEATRAAPHLDEPSVISTPAGDHPEPAAEPGVDVHALTHNETSTGVAMDLRRPTGTTPDDGLVVVDATSAAGGIAWDPAEVDVYYFAPQKCFGSDGGLWLAACSPPAVDRIEELAASDRWRPASLDLGIALENSRKNQTYNTPAIATLVMLDAQLDWMLDNGGLAGMAGRSARSADVLYRWAEDREWAVPFVRDPAKRSTVVGTIDLADPIDASVVTGVLRRHGVLDTDAYRKLGRNQLRIATFPAIDTDDVAAVTRCVDAIVASLS